MHGIQHISYHTEHFVLSVSNMYKILASNIQELKNLAIFQTKLTIAYKIKRKPIQIITSYCRKNFKQIRQISKGNF